MAQTPAERARAYRARQGSITRSGPQPHGTMAAVRRHQRNPDKHGPLKECEPCRLAYNADQRARYADRRASEQDPLPPTATAE